MRAERVHMLIEHLHQDAEPVLVEFGAPDASAPLVGEFIQDIGDNLRVLRVAAEAMGEAFEHRGCSVAPRPAVMSPAGPASTAKWSW